MAPDKEIIQSNGQIYALIFRKSLRPEGVSFMTPDDYTLQLGLIGHSAGKVIKDHIHNPDIHYKVDTTQEFLYIEKGKVRVTIYTENWTELQKVELGAGDIFLTVAGGHGFEVLEDCYMIEVKQGPFPGDKLMKFYREDAK
jgi:hypothetical protein